MNEVIISGRLTTDCRVLTSQDANNPWTTCFFTLAVDAGTDKQGQKKAEFIECQAWGKLAETISQYNHKGDTILVRAHLAMVSTKDKAGNEMKVARPIVDAFEFGARKQGGQVAPQPQRPAQNQYNQTQQPARQQYQQPQRTQQAPKQMPVYTNQAQPQRPAQNQYNQPMRQQYQQPVQQAYEPQGYMSQGYSEYDDANLVASDYDNAYIEE